MQNASGAELRPTLSNWIMVAALGIIWGGTFLGIEIALRGITPFWLAAGRLVFATTLLAAIRLVRDKATIQPPKPTLDWLLIILVGLMSSAIPFMLLSWGQQYVNSGFAGVSMATVALMVLPLAHIMVPGEQMTWRKSLGFTVGFIGVVILIGGQAFTSSNSELEGFGRLACLGAAACYAISSVIIRKLSPIDPIDLATLLIAVGAVAVVPIAWIIEGPPTANSWEALIALAILGLIPTAGANLLRVMVIRSAGPTFMSLTNYQVPVWSVIFGFLFLSEELPSSLLISLLLILCGVAISQWRTIKNLFTPKQ